MPVQAGCTLQGGKTMNEEIKNKSVELTDEEAEKAAAGTDYSTGIYYTCKKCGNSVMAYLTSTYTLTCPVCGDVSVHYPSGPK